VKYAFVATERTGYPVSVLCRVLGVSVSGFYAYVARCRRSKTDPDVAVRADLRAIHGHSRGTYGRPRLTDALRTAGHPVNPKRVQRLMHEEGLRGVRKGGFKPCTTDSRHPYPIAPNVLDRRFAVDADVEAWVSDITYIPTRQGWLYLAIVMALHGQRDPDHQAEITIQECTNHVAELRIPNPSPMHNWPPSIKP
jgi:putative transposase